MFREAGGDSDIFFTSSSFTSQGNNLIGSTGSQTYTWTTGDVVGTESSKVLAQLGSLAEAGGYVPVCLPNASSPVINPGVSSAPFVDARGYLRVNTADKGAAEYGGTLPVALPPLIYTSTSFIANWQDVPGATDYALDVATDSGFNHLVSGFDNLQTGATPCWLVKGLAGQGTYYYRVRAQNGAHKTWHSNTIAVNLAYTPTCTATATATAPARSS